MEKAPKNPYALDTLGWAQLRAGDLAAAAGNLEEAHRLLPSNAEVTFHLGLAYGRLGKSAQARSLLEEALRAAAGAGWREEAARELEGLGPQAPGEESVPPGRGP